MDETTHDLVLYARNANVRIKNEDPKRIKLVSGAFLDHDTLDEAMHGVDLVYLNDMGNVGAVRHIIETMQANHVKLIICASILGIYDEVVGKFGEWNDQMIGSSPRNQDQKDSAAIVEESGLDYIILRLTWLYNDESNEDYAFTKKGEAFVGAQVTREAVARAIVDLIESTEEKHPTESLGIYQPGSEHLEKPFFY